MDGTVMQGTVVSDVCVPAKLIIGDKEIDVTLVGHSYKEEPCHNKHNYLKSIVYINIEETFVCTREFTRFM